MRIGIIHGFYRSNVPSGENKTVEDIARILVQNGHEVSFWQSQSDKLVDSKKKQFKRAIEITFDDPKNDEFSKWVDNQDSIQIHNYFPVVSQKNLETLAKSGKRMVRVIHNYRKTCLSGNHYRKNKNCFKCDLNSSISGIVRRCYNSSTHLSTYMTFYNGWIEQFESNIRMDYIAISPSVKKYLIECGIDQTKIEIIPNSTPEEAKINDHATDCIFVGRIETEKGVFKLVDLWRKHEDLPTLHIVGDGTGVELLQNSINKLNNVIFHGVKFGTDLANINQNAKLAIFPVLWREPFGRVVVEALSRGQAIACSNNLIQLGAIESKKNGEYFSVTEEDMYQKILNCLALDSRTHIRVSREKWQKNYAPEIVSEKWKQFYTSHEKNYEHEGLI